MNNTLRESSTSSTENELYDQPELPTSEPSSRSRNQNDAHCVDTQQRKKRRRRTHANHVLKDLTSEDDDDIIVNISSHTLTPAERSVLRKGLKFVPTPTQINRTELAVDTKRYSRRMRLKEFFSESEAPSTFNKYKKSKFTPPHGRDRTLDSYLITLENTVQNLESRHVHSNLSQDELTALRSLRENQSIVIFPADKGGAVVIQDRSSYIDIVKEHLESKTTTNEDVYQRLQTDCTPSIAKKIDNAIQEAALLKVIDSDTAEGLKVKNSKPGNLYCLPKIHKKPGDPKPPPRPICNSRDTPTEKISQWVDDQLQPLVKELPSYVKDDNDFLRKVQTINNEHDLPPGTILATWDVKSLYTNIPTEGGLEGCKYFLTTNGRSINVINIVLKFIGLILNCNIFRFGNAHYLQKCGTAMGTKMAPSYANLFMGYVEKDLLERCEKKPLVWYRYIDDIFFIWTHGREELAKFLTFCNNNRHGITFEVTPDSVSTESVPFLDIRIILHNNKLHTDLYVKPTDKFQYLNFTSSHPFHQKASLPYGLALRIKRICSNQSDFRIHCQKLVGLLRRRGFKLGLIKEGIRKAAAVDRAELLREHTEEEEVKEERMIFATTYNPKIAHLKDKVTNLHHMLHSSEKCKKLYPKPPVMAYRRGRNLNDLLVSRRLPPDTQIYPQPPAANIDTTNNKCEECGRLFKNGKGKMIHYKLSHSQNESTPNTDGFHKCGDKRCKTCKLGTFGNTIPITSTNKTFTIRNSITCKTANVIYCVTCGKCRDQYIGETEQEIHERQRGHLSDIKSNKPGLPYVVHFQQCGIEHYTITGVEKIRKNCSETRKGRERFYKKHFDVKIK